MSDILLSVIEQYSRVSLRLIADLRASQARVEALEVRLAEAQTTERALVISLHEIDPRSSCDWFDAATSDALGLPELSMLDQMASETRSEDFDPIIMAAMRRVIARRRAPPDVQPLPSSQDAAPPGAPADLTASARVPIDSTDHQAPCEREMEPGSDRAALAEEAQARTTLNTGQARTMITTMSAMQTRLAWAARSSRR